jgi:predicted MFS family arabinose efflux permease
MVLAGIPIAPAFASSYGLVDRLAVPGTTTEAFSWLSTAIVTGISLGTAVGGLVIEHAGVTWSLALAPPSALAAALTVLALRSSLTPPPGPAT